MLPALTENGFLPPGVHESGVTEFIQRFCSGRDREKFFSAVSAVVAFSSEAGAVDLLVGGSFVASTKVPNDLDCVAIFRAEKDIPEGRQGVEIGGLRVDLFFCSIEQDEVLASFKKMFSRNRIGQAVGCVIVHLRSDGRLLWNPQREPGRDAYDAVTSVYINRQIIERPPREKALVTVHGIRTSAEWNSEVSLIASMNGWVVAPFQYGYVNVDVFVDRLKRNALLDQFREYVFELKHSFNLANISIIAHSFGTYIVIRYLLGFDDPPVQFDSVILCGAIVDHRLDLDRFRGKAAIVCNEVAPNDEWADWAKRANFGQDEYFGNAATLGFESKSSRLIQRRADIFTHNNVIRRDVVVQRWMPILESHVGAIARERSAERA
jgi:pimeloyl-ACP methyl ester carboxylesterase